LSHPCWVPTIHSFIRIVSQRQAGYYETACSCRELLTTSHTYIHAGSRVRSFPLHRLPEWPGTVNHGTVRTYVPTTSTHLRRHQYHLTATSAAREARVGRAIIMTSDERRETHTNAAMTGGHERFHRTRTKSVTGLRPSPPSTPEKTRKISHPYFDVCRSAQTQTIRKAQGQPMHGKHWRKLCLAGSQFSNSTTLITGSITFKPCTQCIAWFTLTVHVPLSIDRYNHITICCLE